jgi:hypothetical protein
MGRHRKSAISEVITGIIMISIPFILSSGGGWMGMHMGFSLWRWILVVIGAGSLIRGTSRLIIKSRKLLKNRPNSKEKKLELENKVLKAAQAAGGKVTVARTALYIDAPIEETEVILNSLASRGFANVEVSSEGQIFYLFPDFLDRDLIES